MTPRRAGQRWAGRNFAGAIRRFAHRLHLDRHSLELARTGGRHTAAIMGDVATPGGLQAIAVDFRAGEPRSTLFHGHQQERIEFGFMALVDTA